MGVRSSVINLNGRTVTTATLVVATMLGTLSARAASRQWDSEPAPSVLVESGGTNGGLSVRQDIGRDFFSDGATFGSVSDAPSADESVAIADDGVCTACNGAGCDGCHKHAIFDLAGCHHQGNGCWAGRADALLLWRNAPAGGPIVNDNSLVAGSGLRAAGMDSTPAAGPRFSILRVNKCTGNAIEATYLRAANFRSIRPLGGMGPYELAAPPIYGTTVPAFESANANLGASLQSFEFNRHHCIAPCVRFLAGFRWIEWQEQFSMQTYDITGAAADSFQTNCYNDLYGGQIGLDANLLATRWIRFDSVVKAGAYYNVGAQSSLYTTTGGTAGTYASDSPLSGAFAGEVGLTGVIPLTCCIDLRIGYFGLWLSGIAQPTKQLADQVMPSPPEVAAGTINANGGVLVQGVSLGLEGRW
jgi:hypothetical protein